MMIADFGQNGVVCMECNIDKVFVYGTLKRGMGNALYLEDSEYLGPCAIPGALINLGSYPAFVLMDGQEDLVFGEVYQIGVDTFLALDRLEGYPGFYNRTIKDTEYGKAWVYYIPKENMELERFETIESGVWTPELREKELWQ